MTRILATAALAAVLSATTLSASLALPFGGPGRMGMMGGGCAMMGMIGQGMMGGGPWGPGFQGFMGQGSGAMMDRQPRIDAVIEGRLAYLKGELDITDAQAAAWTGYADAVKARIDLMQGMRQSMFDAMQKGTAIERMDVRIANMEAMLEAMKELKPATEALYAALSDEQKAVADELIGADCGAM
jgi:hypothetical protein